MATMKCCIGVGEDVVLKNFAPIEMIQDYEISYDIVDKLKKAGHFTLSSLAFVSKETLMATLTDLDEQVVHKIYVKLSKFFDLDLNTQRMTLKMKPTHITTGSSALNNLLGGGLEMGRVYKVFGQPDTGKTQFCTSIALTCQLSYELGGTFAKSLYIGPQSLKCKQSIMGTIEKYNLNIDNATNNMFIASPQSADDLTRCVLLAKQMMSRDEYAILILDDVIAYNNGASSSMNELTADIMAKFNNFLHLLAKDYGCAIVVTDRVSGPLVGINTNSIRLLFTKSTAADHFECQIIDSKGVGGRPAAFCIKRGAITDLQVDS